MDTKQNKDVYKPMLSEFIVDLSAQDLKLQEQWIVRRKQIVYLATIIAIFTVLICTVSIVYVIPHLSPLSDTTVTERANADIEINFDNRITRMQLQNTESLLEFEEPSFEDDYYGEYDTSEDDDLNVLNTELMTNENEKYLYCVVSSSPEIKKFTNSCNSVVFVDVADEASDVTQLFPEDFDLCSIVNVRITSPVSEKMLQKIVAAFPNIGRLTVGIDKLCLGSYEAKRENLPVIDLPQLETLEVVNATRCPDLASWLFSKWNTPAIQKISISQADIPRSVFQNLAGFIERHNQTLLSVDFIRCSFGNCDVAGIPLYHNLTITETETRKIK